MRVFIAVELSNKNNLKKIQTFQENLEINAKPTKINQIHFTLQFLGEIDEKKCEKVKDRDLYTLQRSCTVYSYR